MTDKHTPGPWGAFEEVDANDRCRVTVGTFDTDGGIAEALMWTYGSNIDALANARLIAAAPLMLEALREIVIRFSDEVEPYQIAREAIRAATGEDA